MFAAAAVAAAGEMAVRLPSAAPLKLRLLLDTALSSSRVMLASLSSTVVSRPCKGLRV